jgi:hypothetical protein
MVDKKQGCHLLFASHIDHNVIQKEENKSIKYGVRSGLCKGIYHAMLIC